MDLTSWVEQYSTAAVLATGGAVIGALFGFFAQRSRFCLRAAVLEFWRGKFGEKLSVWLLAFSTAVVVAQALVLTGHLDVTQSRQLAARGSLSGAAVGGLLFGAGMIMTRGCASRLLVLSANGNLRALLSGLVFAVTAQASLAGALAPLRTEVSSWWTVDGGAARDLLARVGSDHWGGLLFGLGWMAVAIVFSLRTANRFWMWVGGIGTGLAVALAWWFSYAVSQSSFDMVQVQGLTFSGPSAEWLMRVLTTPGTPFGFDAGMLPGVFIGSALGALIGREFKVEGFKDGYSMARYIVGAMAMGFGSMLAGGCAVGAGMTGGSIFALTAWITLLGMWAGAGVMDRLLAEPVQTHHPATQRAPVVVPVAP
ncbi:YeeE/YedE family protein [Ottowia sp. GY511]|uniref:YeeE/YedE family protein n=1 Tax=Ottowia flava TaxID=2675430 RepID=A0ABW4KZ11_9BURK|nr:YeeE/YedE family protein [Ottowia sp. GY511]TXK29802.1 YeeE/YedE family protein [Ottowia sp. GY511]